jgi:hypothetical protein
MTISSGCANAVLSNLIVTMRRAGQTVSLFKMEVNRFTQSNLIVTMRRPGQTGSLFKMEVNLFFTNVQGHPACKTQKHPSTVAPFSPLP